MHIYTNALGSVPTQYFLLFKYLIPTLFSFFFLSVFHSIFFPPFLLPFFPFVLFTSPFFLLFFFFLPFFFFFFFLFSPPSFFPLLFLFASFLHGMSDQSFECPATFGHERTYCTGIQKTYLELCYLIISTPINNWLHTLQDDHTHFLALPLCICRIRLCTDSTYNNVTSISSLSCLGTSTYKVSQLIT